MKEKIKFLMDRGYLLEPDVLGSLDESSFNLIKKYLDPEKNPTISLSLLDDLKSKYLKECIVEEREIGVDESPGSVEVLKSYDDPLKKVEVDDFIEHYKVRYNKLRQILQNRSELTNAVSINRLFHKPERETVSLIGVVYNKEITRNGNIMLEVEDTTGSIKVLVNSNKQDLFKKASNIVLDEVIGVNGNMGTRIVFANDILFPDVPLNGNNLKKSPVEEYMAFISDVHVGSNLFLEEEFLRFIKWLNGEVGSTEQKKVARAVKYLVIAGDVVDGIGVYPGQDEELTIHDLKSQYDKFAEYIKLIRNDIKIIICPGNHDAIRLAEPQPAFDKELAKSLYELDNVVLVTNPSMVNIGKRDGFSGFNLLIYHGFSFDYYIDRVEEIRLNGGYDRGDLVMKFLLQKRHLAPTHTSTLFVVNPSQDGLIIDEIPDFFLSGHIHKLSVSKYGKTSMLCGSCWQAKTAFQEKVGHHPEPCRVPIINLKTRDIKVMKFCD